MEKCVAIGGIACTSDDLIYRKYRYIIFDIDISYRIVEKNIEFFDILRYLLYIMIFSIYHDILCQKFIFLLLHCQNNENNRENNKLAKANKL